MHDDIEEWRPVVGFEGIYEVSNRGRVRGLDRHVSHTRYGSQKIAGKVFRPVLSSGYLQVQLSSGNGNSKTISVHILVARAFLGPPRGMEVRHLDGDPANNDLKNLRYGTHSENMNDRKTHGTCRQSAKTHCAQGHPFNSQNTRYLASGRQCRICSRENQRRYRKRLQARRIRKVEN